MNKTIIQIIKNMLTGWGVVGLQAVIGLVMVPFLLGKLGRDGYGAIAILMSIIGFAEIADLGLRAALNRELSEKVAKKDIEGFRRLSSSALVLYVGLALGIGLIGAIFAPQLCALFRVGDAYLDVMILLLRTYAPLAVLLSFVIPVFSAGICSSMRYDVQNNISMFAQLLISLGLFVCLSVMDANPLLIWCGVRLVGEFVRLCLMGCFYRKICEGGKLGYRYICRKSLIPLFKLGGSMYVLQLTRVLAQRMDPLIISRFIGLGGVALYQAGSRLPQMMNPLVLSAVNQLVPLTTKFHVNDNQAREQQLLILGTKYTLYLGAFFSATMILFADSFCHLWLFDKLGGDVKTVAVVLKMWAVANLFNYAGGSQWSILLGKKKMKFAVWLNVPVAVFNVILSVYLVGFTKLGLVGVLVGTVLSEVIRRPVVSFYVSKIIGLKFGIYFLRAYVEPMMFLLVLILIGRLGQSWVVLDSWGELVCSGFALGLVSVVLLSVLERRLIFAQLRNLRGRFCL